jgi:hypothetical protein
MEFGLRIMGGPLPRQVAHHFAALIEAEILFLV